MGSSVGSVLLAAGPGGLGLLLLYRLVAITGTLLLLKQAQVGQSDQGEVEIEFGLTGIKVRRSFKSSQEQQESENFQAEE